MAFVFAFVLVDEAGYYPYFKYNNTDTKYKLIQLLEQDYNGKFDISMSDNPSCELSDFFRKGNTFGDGKYSMFQSSDGHSVPFMMEVLEEKTNSVIIKISFK